MIADSDVSLTARNATLEDLTGLLRSQQARMLDVVAGAGAIRAQGGHLVVDGTVPVLGADGVTMSAGRYRPTEVCDQGLAAKLRIPAGYLRLMRTENTGLWDANVNGWLVRDDRKFLLRCLRGDQGGGVARAFLSDGYKRIDHLDALVAALDGVRQSGYPVSVEGCDVSDRRMYIRVRCDAVAALAPVLLAGYRSPFTGASGADNPLVSAGFVIANSETGCGAYTVTPRLVAQVCSNGMTIERGKIRAVHQGEHLEEGLVDWSADTVDKLLSLLTAKTRDTVRSILDPAWVERAVRELEQDAGRPVTRPEEAVKVVCAQLRFTKAQQDDILAHFIRGGSLTAGGIMHAVTSVAQAADADTAYEMEAAALPALRLAAAL